MGGSSPGCNIENASFGATVCAERVAIFAAVAAGQRQIKALAVIADTPEPVAPCGLCRQVLQEFGADCQVIMANLTGEYRVLTMAQLLPYAFEFRRPVMTNPIRARQASPLQAFCQAIVTSGLR